MKKLRVFSYNIHKGFGWGINNYTLKAMRQEFRKLHPDLVFLQEVHGHHASHKNRISDWPRGSQFEYLAEKLWPHFTYGKNAIYTDGHHGNAILSKFPILYWENVDISENRFEKRGLLHSVIETSKGHRPLHAFCVHLSLFEADRKRQIARMIDYIRSNVPDEAPTIVAGDFNDWLQKASRPLFSQLGFQEAFSTLHGIYPRTFPSFFPLIPLDRIYFKNASATAAECLEKTPWNSFSDHLPLEAKFILLS